MVEPTEYRNGLDATMRLRWARDGLLLGERLVRARLVVEAREFDDEMSQVLLAGDALRFPRRFDRDEVGLKT